MRRPLIAGNWKMNLVRHEAYALVEGIIKGTAQCSGIDTLICPPALYLEVAAYMAKGSPLSVGAQNLFYEESGAYTGEISAPMLRSLGCSSVIIGHSERRTYFQESNGDINRKIKVSLKWGITPIFCIGETLEQRRDGVTFEVLNEQLIYGLQGIEGSSVGGMVIAYEPVWAIGTGMSAQSSQAEEVHRFIREVIAQFSDGSTAEKMRIIYGGSVAPANADELLSCVNVDGALVGGASLKTESFCGIVEAAAALCERSAAPS